MNVLVLHDWSTENGKYDYAITAFDVDKGLFLGAKMLRHIHDVLNEDVNFTLFYSKRVALDV